MAAPKKKKSVTLKNKKANGEGAPSKTPSTVYEAATIVRVSRTVKIDGEDEASDLEAEEIIEINQFVTQPAVVRFSFPLKRCVSFQSVGLEIGIDLPCYVEEIDAGMGKAKDIVVSRMKEHLPEVNTVLDHLIELKRQADGR
jgi:hypothetical protein